MPGLNQRGPMNEGPMTGRGLGKCTGSDAVTDNNTAPARRQNAGFGAGRGMGMGRRGCRRPGRGMGGGRWADTTVPEMEAGRSFQSLSEKTRQLEAELAAVKAELEQIKSS